MRHIRSWAPHLLHYLGAIVLLLMTTPPAVGQIGIPPVSFIDAWNYSISGIAVVTGDFNGDGRPDLVVPHYSSACSCIVVSILLGNGDGTFQSSIDSFVCGGNCDAGEEPGEEVSPGLVAVGDFNGDGKLDLALAGSSVINGNYQASIDLLLGNGDGSFQSPLIYPVATFPKAIVAADFNGDGKLDLAGTDGAYPNSYEPGENDIAIFLGNGDGTFQSASLINAGSNVLGLAAGDFNGDGKPDLAVTDCGDDYCETTGSVNILLGNGDGTFQSPLMNPVGLAPLFLVAGDFNGDKKLDLVVASRGDFVSGVGDVPGYLDILLGNGDGTFQSATQITTGDVNWPVAADFNSDGNLDLATIKVVDGSNPLKSYLQIFLGSGTGRFPITKKITLSIPYPYLDMVAGQFNSDSKPDLVIVDSSVMVFVNDSKTTSTVLSSAPPSAYGQAVTFTAKITPNPAGTVTGHVTFKFSTGTSIKVAVANNVASYTETLLPTGTKSVTAYYSGDSNYGGSASNTVSQLVTKASTTTVLSSSLNPSTYGQSVTFTATVSPEYAGTPTGRITFKFGTKVLGAVTLSGGTATYTTSTLPKGSDVITAGYSGSANFTTSSASATETVN
jgi:Bacterial Ig-like domain (group 3)/FG-GAP-like repeat/FG-GAP repeat